MAIAVPRDLDLVGTYWSMLMVEPVAPEVGGPKPAGRQCPAAPEPTWRYGVQVVTHVGSQGLRSIRFAAKRLALRSGQPVLEVDIENTGDQWVRPFVWLDVAGSPDGAPERLDGGRMRIFPGCSARASIDLSALKPGLQHGVIVVDNGDEHVFGTRVEWAVTPSTGGRTGEACDTLTP